MFSLLRAFRRLGNLKRTILNIEYVCIFQHALFDRRTTISGRDGWVKFDVVHREIISPCILGPQNNDGGKRWVIDLDVVHREIISPCMFVPDNNDIGKGWVG